MSIHTWGPLLGLFHIVSLVALASDIHVEHYGQYGGAAWASSFSGHLSGAPQSAPGSGSVKRISARLALGEASMPIERTNLDISYIPLNLQTTATGVFAFNGEIFDGTAGLDFRASLVELILRFRLLERNRMAFNVMAGTRLVSTDIQVFGLDYQTVASDFLILPEVGASLHVSVKPRLLVFTTLKWFDYAWRTSHNHTLDVAAGVSYHFLPVHAEGAGIRGSLGYRHLNLEAKTRVGDPEQAGFDVTLAGPWLAVTAVF